MGKEYLTIMLEKPNVSLVTTLVEKPAITVIIESFDK